MTRKITMKALESLDGAGQDFAALADQWIDRSWHLPPGGDHSWREREAQRIFGGFGNESLNDKEDPPPVGQADPTEREMDGRHEPGFKRAGAHKVALPILLTMCAMLFGVAILVPEILTSSFWDSRRPKALSDAPIRVFNGAAEGNVTASSAYGRGSNRDKDEVVSQTFPQPAGQAAAPVNVGREMDLPLLRPSMPITARHNRQSSEHAVHVAKARSLRRAQYPGKRFAKSLPPIGATYFASHAPAAGAAKSTTVTSRPIGEAYFENHSPATTNRDALAPSKAE